MQILRESRPVPPNDLVELISTYVDEALVYCKDNVQLIEEWYQECMIPVFKEDLNYQIHLDKIPDSFNTLSRDELVIHLMEQWRKIENDVLKASE